MQTGCAKVYSLGTAKKVFRKVYRHPSIVTRHERAVIKRVIRCQASPARKRRVKIWHAGWKRSHAQRRAAYLQRKALAGTPQAIARYLLRNRPGQYPCLAALISRESGWNVRADNPTSDAYGIPQALPGSKMATHGSDWQTNPRTQLRWMISYCDGRYGSPCAADSFQRANGYY